MTASSEKKVSNLLHVFRYRVDFHDTTQGKADKPGSNPVCSGKFSEVTGFEASMEPFTFQQGGQNWGEIQRAGKTTFATLVLKRGMTEDRALWQWFHGFATGAYAYRLTATVTVLNPAQAANEAKGTLAWQFANCVPVKLKAADLSASASEIGIEELHLNHEGMELYTDGIQAAGGGA